MIFLSPGDAIDSKKKKQKLRKFILNSKSYEFHPNKFYMLCFDYGKLVLKNHRQKTRNNKLYAFECSFFKSHTISLTFLTQHPPLFLPLSKLCLFGALTSEH